MKEAQQILDRLECERSKLLTDLDGLYPFKKAERSEWLGKLARGGAPLTKLHELECMGAAFLELVCMHGVEYTP